MHEIISLKVEGHDNLIHIIADRASGDAAVVDPAWDAEGIAEVLAEEALSLRAIFITHAHDDHVNAVAELRQADTAIFIAEAEYPRWADAPADAILLRDGDEILLGSASIQMLATPGHTAGSCCYRTGLDLLCGDTLFIYGCGNVRDASASAEALFDSLQRLKKLPPAMRLHCGHDYGVVEVSTLDEQRRGNPFLMIENKDDFIRYRRHIAARTRAQPYGALAPEALAEALRSHSEE